MKLRKIIPFILAAVLLLGGCGGNHNKNKTKVGILFASYTHTAQQEALLAGLSQAGYLGVPMSANEDHTLQLTQLSGLVEQNFPLVVIEPVETENADQLAEILKKAEIPGIFIGQEPAEAVLDSWDKLFYVGVDEALQGTLQGQMLQNSMDSGDINGDGEVVYAILHGPPDDAQADMITQYCDEAMQNAELESRHLETQISDGTKEGGKECTKALLTRYGKDLEVLLCNNDALAMGAVQAVQAGGWRPGQDIYIIGVGGTQEMLALIEQGKCAGTVIPDETARAEQLASIAKALAENTEVEKRLYAGYLPITKENVSIFREEQ